MYSIKYTLNVDCIITNLTRLTEMTDYIQNTEYIDYILESTF